MWSYILMRQRGLEIDKIAYDNKTKEKANITSNNIKIDRFPDWTGWTDVED